MTRKSSETGFSLIETLVTLAVISAMAGMLFEAISTNARATQHVAQKRVATMFARSLLAQAMVPTGPDRLRDSGQSGALAWRLSRRPFGQGARDDGIPIEEVRIDIVERATGRPLTSVRTLRLAR